MKKAFNRKATPIPPPVVCLSNRYPIIASWISIEIEWKGTTWVENGNGQQIVNLGLRYKPVSGTLPSVSGYRSRCWRSSLIPAQPRDPITDQLLPYPTPPTMTTGFLQTSQLLVSYLVTRYDAVVTYQWLYGTKVGRNGYIDLGILQRKELH